MKRRFVVLMMLCIILTSCAPTYIEESSAVSEDQGVISEQSQDDSVLDDMTFPDRYREILLDAYKGKTDEQLEAEFEYNPDNCSGICMAQSATSIYFLDGRKGCAGMCRSAVRPSKLHTFRFFLCCHKQNEAVHSKAYGWQNRAMRCECRRYGTENRI